MLSHLQTPMYLYLISTVLLTSAKKGARGKAQENIVMNPNWMTISRYSVMIMAGQVGARKKSLRCCPVNTHLPDLVRVLGVCCPNET